MGDAAATGLVPGVFDVVVMRHVLAHNGGREQEKRGAGATTLSIGLKLGELLAGAGLEVVDHRGWYEISAVPPGSRTPSWAARDAMVEAGFAAREDVDRWAAAWSRMDNQPAPRTMFLPLLSATGRRTS